jgi:glycerophosphoryl diester phosphodiesterase
LLGHRGASAVVPENTLAALRRAIVDGADGIECDVRVLGDGTPILMHDDRVDRTTNGKGPVRDFDLPTLRTLTVEDRENPGRGGQSVPSLDEVLDELFGRTFLALELKDPMPETFFAALGERHLADREAECLLASFEVDHLIRARDQLPSIARAVILRAGQPIPDDTVLTPLGLAAVLARHEDVDERFVVEMRRRGLAAWAYTVNEPEEAARLVKIGASGIISDDPGAVRSVIPPLD